MTSTTRAPVDEAAVALGITAAWIARRALELVVVGWRDGQRRAARDARRILARLHDATTHTLPKADAEAIVGAAVLAVVAPVRDAAPPVWRVVDLADAVLGSAPAASREPAECPPPPVACQGRTETERFRYGRHSQPRRRGSHG